MEIQKTNAEVVLYQPVRKIRTVQKERKRNVVAKTTIRRSDIDEAWTFYQILCKKFAFMETLLFLCTNNHKQIS